MKRIRQDIDANPQAWEDLVGDKTLVKTFGTLYGEQLGSAPRGYAKDHPAIHLLRYKQFMLRHLFSDEDVLSPDFLSNMNDVFKKMRPFLDFMSEVLTTDANGRIWRDKKPIIFAHLISDVTVIFIINDTYYYRKIP